MPEPRRDERKTTDGPAGHGVTERPVPPAESPFFIDFNIGRSKGQRVVTVPLQRWRSRRHLAASLPPITMSQRIGTVLSKQGRFGTLEIPSSEWEEFRQVVESLGASMYLKDKGPRERGLFLDVPYVGPCYLVGVEFPDGLDQDEVIAVVDPALASIVNRHRAPHVQGNVLKPA